jgi:transposase
MSNFLYLSGWEEADVTLTDNEYVVTASYEPEPDHCAKCGAVGHLYRHGSTTVSYRDAPVRGHHVAIEVTRRRYRCRTCLDTFLQPTPDLDEDRRMTVRCRLYVEEQAMEKPFAHVAKEVGIDEKTVRDMSAARIAVINRRFRPYAPRTLGIDELTLDGKLRVMLTDIDRSQPIDILDTYSKARVVHWLCDLADPGAIETVAMDMSTTFRAAVRAVLPDVPIVADKFHVVRAATGAINSVRIAIGRKAETKAAKKKAFRGRHALLKRPSNLTPEQVFKLDGMLKDNRDLAEAYEAKEGFYRIWDAPTRDAAEKAVDAWLAAVPEQYASAFVHATRALVEWRKEVLAYWDSRAVTNAYTESTNGLAKIANRTGRGYGFEVIRARILHTLRTVNPDEMVRCHRCRIGFMAGMLVAQDPVTMGRGRLKKEVTLCPSCYVSNGRRTKLSAGLSTRQSG